MSTPALSARDQALLERAIEAALEAERGGNLPVGAVIGLDGALVVAAGNAVLQPSYHPGRHAEIEALRQVPDALWPQAARMTCYTTLEPCMMCMGALLLHGVGRVVFGAIDPMGGAGQALAHLPRYYAAGRGAPAWLGPAAQARCAPLYERASRGFQRLPCSVPFNDDDDDEASAAPGASVPSPEEAP